MKKDEPNTELFVTQLVELIMQSRRTMLSSLKQYDFTVFFCLTKLVQIACC